MLKTRLINTAAAFIFGLGAVTGTVLTFAAPASASSADSHTVGPFSGDPYPETNPFPQLPGNPWGH